MCISPSRPRGRTLRKTYANPRKIVFDTGIENAQVIRGCNCEGEVNCQCRLKAGICEMRDTEVSKDTATVTGDQTQAQPKQSQQPRVDLKTPRRNPNMQAQERGTQQTNPTQSTTKPKGKSETKNEYSLAFPALPSTIHLPSAPLTTSSRYRGSRGSCPRGSRAWMGLHSQRDLFSGRGVKLVRSRWVKDGYR
ncbi:hypothetical protein FA13DRAFT_812740 [Coprinellus micaceus]|uniref:Uncharacterized protein n=1 Tax=Coprinellus micaceus TaxID=71717 RepID=A0A4Y7S4M4_COPMI|nr:hypothetical protein FA13DRAFT_812740 [Coprinellus micaceus]